MPRVSMLFKALMAGLIVLALAATPAAAQSTAIEGFEQQTTVAGLSRTVGMAYAPDGRIFAVEKGGRLWAIRADGTRVTTAVLDLRARVNSYSDRGLLGVAVDKDFATNGYVYLLYAYELAPTAPDQGGPSVSRLTRIKVNADNTVANPSDPETVILGTYAAGACPAPANDVDCIPADFYWHTIGTVRVDPVDGTLWVGSGDATGGDTSQQAFRTYNEQSFAGKLIHIDREGRGLPGHPFCQAEEDLTKVCTKLHAKGFRNPFRFTLRPGKFPIVGDVGYATQEELDVAKPGGNYGWPCYEGSVRTPGYRYEPGCAAQYANEDTPDEALDPLYSYPHGDGASITAGPQYDGTAYPAEYRGDIFFGDYVQGWIKRLEVTADDALVSVEDFATDVPAYTDLQQDPQGRVAFMDVGGLQTNLAAIHRFDYSTNRSPVARASAAPATGPLPLAVTFTGDQSSDPNGDPLTYDWDFGDGTAHATAANPTHTYTTDGIYDAKLTVTDPHGRSASTTVKVRAGTVNDPPVATITAPAPALTYAAGQRIELSATATDPQDGTLSGDALTWQVVVRHNTHLHEHFSATGATTSFVAGNDHDSDSHFEIRLTATDSQGAVDEKVVVIKPKTVRYTLNSSPRGAPVVYSGQPEQGSPLAVQAAVGFQASISAAETFVSGGRTYRFTGWSNGGTRSKSFAIPAVDTAVVAQYAADDAETLTFNPTADTVVNASTPTAPKGSSSQIGVDASPAEQSLLRFGVAGVAGRRVLGTRLALHGKDGSASGGRVFRTASDDWTEASTTWETRPAFLPGQLGTFFQMRSAEWFEAALAAGSLGDGSLSLGMDSVHGDGADYSSRDSAAKPRLVVEVDRRRPSGASAPSAKADFNGDGYEDVAAGAPEEDLNTGVDAGAVHILYGAPIGAGERSGYLTQNSHQIAGDYSQDGDAFGGALAAGDFDGDGYDDLAVGAPGEDLGTARDAGAVTVIRGSDAGLLPANSTHLTQDTSFVADAPEAGDAFGMVLAAGDSTGDGKAELAVGVPWEDQSAYADAGAVHLLRGGPTGPAGSGSQFWRQDSSGVADGGGNGDEFGGALAFGDLDGDGKQDLAVAAPLEDLGQAIADAGVVHVLPGASAGLTASGSRLFSQSSAGVPDTIEAADRFGSALAAGDLGGDARADLAIGVPGEDHTARTDAGALHVLLGGAGGLTADGSRLWTQASPGIDDTAEHGDRFGGVLAAGRFAGGERDALTVGVPDEDLGTLRDAGAVHVIPAGAGGLTATGSRLWTQNTAGIDDASGPGDRFGAAVAALNATSSGEDDLIVGVPGEGLGSYPGAGVLHVLPGSASGLTASGSRVLSQNSPAVDDVAEAGDGLGGSLGG